jgi:hypothetical protein
VPAGFLTARRSTIAVAIGTLLVLLAMAPAGVERHSLSSIDTAIKLIQATELSRSWFRTMALTYPARDIDPDEQFLPFVPPFVFMSAGRWQSIFSSFYALLAAPLVPLGLPWLVGLSMLATAVATAAVTRLPGASVLAAPLTLLATPVWLYALNPTETPLALACATAAMAAGARIAGPRGDWIAGLLLGLATLLRDETLLLGPGLLYARVLTGSRPRELARTVAAIAAPLVVMAAVDQWWFRRPMLAHLRHAVPGLDLVLPRARAMLPHLDVMTWRERLTTVVEYWLLGFGGLAAAGVGVWLVLAHTARRCTPWIVAGLVLAAAALHVVDLAALLPAPRSMAGLFRLSPFLLLALVPRAGGEPAPPLVRLAWVASGCYLAVVALTINTEGGKPTGPRLIIALWPLLAAAAVDTLRGYLAAARHAWTARVTAAAGLLLVAGSLTMELGVILRAVANRNAGDGSAARLVRAVGDRVIVLETLFELDLTGPLYFKRAIMMAEPRQRRDLSRTLAAAGVERFTLVVRPPVEHPPDFPEYRQAEAWEEGRYVISRWVRAPASGP